MEGGRARWEEDSSRVMLARPGGEGYTPEAESSVNRVEEVVEEGGWDAVAARAEAAEGGVESLFRSKGLPGGAGGAEAGGRKVMVEVIGEESFGGEETASGEEAGFN